MFFNLLTSVSGSDTGSNGSGGFNWPSLLMIGGLFVVIVVWMIFSKRSQKKKQEEAQNTLDAVRPGNKVKTIGGVCGIVVEVCPEDNTFILETGSETTGKCYMKFDKQAIYQTDAVAKKEEKPVEEKPAQVEEAPVEAPVEATEENKDAE